VFGPGQGLNQRVHSARRKSREDLERRHKPGKWKNNNDRPCICYTDEDFDLLLHVDNKSDTATKRERKIRTEQERKHWRRMLIKLKGYKTETSKRWSEDNEETRTC
jgi:hypothetical protein